MRCRGGHWWRALFDFGCCSSRSTGRSRLFKWRPSRSTRLRSKPNDLRQLGFLTWDFRHDFGQWRFHHRFCVHYFMDATLLSTSAVSEQWFIYSQVKEFGALVFAATMDVRRVVYRAFVSDIWTFDEWFASDPPLSRFWHSERPEIDGLRLRIPARRASHLTYLC